MANRFNRSIREIRDIERQPLHTNEQNDLLSDINDDVYVRLRRRYERITGLPALEKMFYSHLKDYNQFKDDTQSMLIYLNDVNERQDIMIDKLNVDVDELNKKAKRLKDITDEHTEKIKSITDDLNTFKEDVKNNREDVEEKLEELSSTLDEIQENDKQDKLQSEINEVRKTVEAIKTDLDETQAIEEMKQLNQSLKNFFSVSSNVTENIAGFKDHVYFDIYSLSNFKNINYRIKVQELKKDNTLSEEKVLFNNKDYKRKLINDNYLSLEVNTESYQHIQIFSLYINDVKYHVLQVKFSDYE